MEHIVTDMGCNASIDDRAESKSEKGERSHHLHVRGVLSVPLEEDYVIIFPPSPVVKCLLRENFPPPRFSLFKGVHSFQMLAEVRRQLQSTCSIYALGWKRLIQNRS